ncbi:MAG: acetylornithine/succinylornithine family transaminase [Spirochaetaceae bacterium]|jgi:acetylornithine/N-succinyldiaminopimelate aminotransferase|nr:acetylornithine/succinylornithine family transaminase [Spirochaetaceae bacterium]
MSDVFMNTYHRMPVVFTKGEGTFLTGTDGKCYLDFTAGIAVNCLGHGHPALVKAVKEQAEKLFHTSNYYQSDVSAAFAQKLIAAASGMTNLFFCNSGAEANEGAIKIARKYSFKKYGTGRFVIVTLKGSFHGRTITTLSATGQEKFHTNFGPFTEGFVFIEADAAHAVLERALTRPDVCAFMVEPVQGESGVRPMSDDFMKKAAALCARNDILFIADEVQCGMGRTGTFFACEQYGIKPDIATLAKGIAGGVPAGAVLAGEKAAAVLESGDHGSTFGGNALAAAAGLAVLNVITAPGFMAEIARKGEFFIQKLKEAAIPSIKEIRGRGLMLAADIEGGAAEALEKALAAGLLILSAGPNTLRFLPPYIISEAEIEEGIGILKRILA